MPPVGLVPILLIAIPILLWGWQSAASRKQAFWTVGSWCWGFYAAGFYWIAYALLIDAAQFGWMVPFATLGLGGVVALFPTVTLTAGWDARKLGGPARAIVFAICWTLAEWLRSFVMTGLPWNPLGSVWDDALPMMQCAALVGVNGLSLLTMIFFALLAVAPGLSQRRRQYRVIAVAVALLALLAVAGAKRLQGGTTEFVPDVKLRLVQPNASQEEKWRPANREPALRDLVAMSRGPGFEQITTVIWPESSAPFDLLGDQEHRQVAALAAPLNGLVLAGAPRLLAKPGGGWNFWNSLMAIDDLGRMQGVYDKAHLVPFGEYVPLRQILPLPPVASSMGDFSAGPGPLTLYLPGLPPVGPAICYESIFSGEVVEPGDRRPQWMVVITNDGWFGLSAGPYQHFAAARMRAIEEGLPVARAANTGVSGVIDAYGRVIAKSQLGTKTVVDAFLPTALDPTPYSRWGRVTWLVLMMFSGVFAIIIRRYN